MKKEKQQEKQISKHLRVFRVIRSVLLTVVIIALAAVMIVTITARISGKTPSVFGMSIFRVSSGSMVPAYEVGDVILVKEVDPMALKEGDVVTYRGTKNEFAGKIVTHRVIKAPFFNNGEYYITTQGDANPSADPDVKISDVMGIVQAKIPILNHIYNIFITPWGLVILIALIVAAFFNEIIVFVKSLFGIGFEEEKPESIEDIIARYQEENRQNKEQQASDKKED